MKKKNILTIGLLFIAVYIITATFFRSSNASSPIIISHRGAAGLAPENTLLGIQKAKESHADYAEIDVQQTIDGVLVLLHDKTVNRTTNGEGSISTLSLLEVQRLDAGTYLGGAFSNTSIPTIEEVIENIDLTSFKLAIELKNPELYPGIEQELLELIQKKNIVNSTKIISFNYASLQNIVLKSDNNVSVGLLTIYPMNLPHIQDNQVVSTYWLGVILDPTLVYRMHNKEYQVWVWTVNNPILMKTLIWLGVDGITTDRPDIAANIFK